MPHERSMHPTRFPGDSRGLGRFLAAYRGQLTRAEAARRSGLSESRWAQVEAGDGIAIPPHTVAAMCAAVGADVAAGLKLAGHDPDRYRHLIAAPPGLMHHTPSLSPRVVSYRAIGDVMASPGEDPRSQIGELYRAAAVANRSIAHQLTEGRPQETREYWAGYSAALQALADEQERVAEQDSSSGTP